MPFSPARRLILAVLASSFALAAPAAATTLQLSDGTLNPQPYQSWVDRDPVPTPAGTVTLAFAGCPGGPAWASGCADKATRTIYLGDGAQDYRGFFHELGHIFDATTLSDDERQSFQSIMRRPGAWVADASSSPPDEWFAEGYSLCARHRRIARTYVAGNYDYAPTPRQHAAVCALIRQSARTSSA